MMTVNINQLADDVAALLGEPNARECQPDESPFPSIDDRVRILAPGILEDLISQSKDSDLGDAKSFTGSVSYASDGCGKLTLPEDFFCLVCFKMNNWRIAVTAPVKPGDRRFAALSSKWNGVKGSVTDPAVALEYTSGRSPRLRISPYTSGSTVETCLYLPRPVFDPAGNMEVPALLLPSLIRQLAATILPTHS